MTQPQLFGMIANRDFEYRNQLYFRGDRFQVSAIDAAIIMRKQDARLTTPHDGPAPAEDEPPPAVAEVAATKHLESAPPKSKRKPRKRKTNRRDIAHAPVTK